MTLKEILAAAKTGTLEFGKTQIASLNSLIEKLPDSLKAQFTQLRDALQGRQTELETLFSAPVTDESAAVALQGLTGAFTKLQDYCTSLFGSVQVLTTQANNDRVALQALDKKVSDGELVSKDKIKGLTDASFQQGVDSVMPQIIYIRKQTVALAGLPNASEDVLKLPTDRFNALIDVAKKNVGALKEKFGFALNGAGKEWVEEAAFQDEATFTKTVGKISALMPNRPTGDPMLGGGGGGTGTKRFGGC